MSNTLYEYKDEKDWYVAEWGEVARSTVFSQIPSEVSDLVADLKKVFKHQAKTVSFGLAVFRYSSSFHLIDFLIQMFNQEERRELEIIPYQDALLITEKERLLHVFLPKGGVDLNHFLNQEHHPETLLIATRNEGKTAEFRAIFEKMGYQIENLNDYPNLPDVAETGITFEENARLKAETIAKLTGKMVIADDSGLKVNALGGLPGVWSARFAGNGATDDENNAKLLHELAMVFDLKDRVAQFHTTLVVASPEKDSLVVEAEWEGYINFSPKGTNGFGYDPLFLVGDTGKTSAELSLQEKNEQSHRAQAVKKLVEVFPKWKHTASL